MDYLEEINVYLLNVNSIFIVKITITFILTIVTIILWKRLRPPEESSKSKARENIEDSDEELEEETSGQELGLMGKIKSAKLREMEQKLSEEQKTQENEIQKQQLAAIFELLKKQQEELNAEKITEDDFNAQLKLYR
ncbi:matrix-remodeling-associated protein 7 [Phlebotomus papatasi]|uniref:Matrix-remodeling-associated protein 7 helical domain-containing protein n=1 Tax=Phlebotomus papatasi TaxID=29031 RepID=A0A1B0DPU6_PHLPP|nr:matrix-remodeling-associated protein 7 [Phlebotomus papatasi]